jgi:hypothetical protein
MVALKESKAKGRAKVRDAVRAHGQAFQRGRGEAESFKTETKSAPDGPLISG